MRDGADAGDADGDGAGARLCARDEFGRRIDAERRRDHEHGRHPRHQADRHVILERIVGQILAEAGIDRDRADGGEEQRVAVGLRLGHGLRGDRAVGARLVLDDDGLAEISAHAFGQDTSDEVGVAAGREADHHADRAVGIVLRLRRQERSGRRERDGGKHAQVIGKSHIILPVLLVAERSASPQPCSLP